MLVLMVFVAAASGLGCTSPPKPSSVAPSHPAPAPAGPQTFSVSVDARSGAIPLAADEYFPSELQVHPGDTIKFNEVWSGEPHTVSLGALVDQVPTSTTLALPPPSLRNGRDVSARRGPLAPECQPETHEHRNGKRDRYEKPRPHPPCHAQTLDEQSTKRRGDDHREALQDRLDREADDAARSFELLAHQRKGGGEPQRLPGHEKEDAQEHSGNRSPEQIQEEAGCRQTAEENQRPAVAEPIR